MTRLDGLHHLSLTVTDVDDSAAWYREVLGFELLARRDAAGLAKAMLTDAGRTVTIVLVGHGEAGVPGRFDEHRAGLDHVGFAVADRAALESWAARLDEHGVEHGEITAGSTGELIAFRDPDGIALEFYTRG